MARNGVAPSCTGSFIFHRQPSMARAAAPLLYLAGGGGEKNYRANRFLGIKSRIIDACNTYNALIFIEICVVDGT